MSNPDFGGPPGTNPPRYQHSDDNNMKVWGWILAAAGAISVFLLVFTFSPGDRTASSNPPAATTGQGSTPVNPPVQNKPPAQE